MFFINLLSVNFPPIKFIASSGNSKKASEQEAAKDALSKEVE